MRVKINSTGFHQLLPRKTAETITRNRRRTTPAFNYCNTKRGSFQDKIKRHGIIHVPDNLFSEQRTGLLTNNSLWRVISPYVDQVRRMHLYRTEERTPLKA